MIQRKGFEIVLASPPDCERLVAEIYFNGKFVLLISQEGEAGTFELETPGPNLKEEEITRKVDLLGLQNAIKQACEELKAGTE